MLVTNALIRQSPVLRRVAGLLAQSVMNKPPAALAASLSSITGKPLMLQDRSSPYFQRGFLSGNQFTALAVRSTSTQISESPPSFARHYYWERVWALAMFPLFPAALFIHNPFMDYALATMVGLHIHWGMESVVDDYARPFVIGETLAKLSHYALYAFSLLMYAGLLHFNYTDVGITKAFEMIWSL